MVHCWIESIFSFPSLFWKTKTKSEIQIAITFLLIGFFFMRVSAFCCMIKVVSFQFIFKPFHMIFNTFNKKYVLKQVYIPAIRNPVSLAFYDRTQTDFGTRVNVGNTTLSMDTTGDKPKVDDPGKNADSVDRFSKRNRKYENFKSYCFRFV